MTRTLCLAVAAILSAIIAGPAGAQGRGGIPVPALPDQPWEYQTANANIRVRVLTAGLENPWSLEFLPDASILITDERNGGCCGSNPLSDSAGSGWNWIAGYREILNVGVMLVKAYRDFADCFDSDPLRQVINGRERFHACRAERAAYTLKTVRDGWSLAQVEAERI